MEQPFWKKKTEFEEGAQLHAPPLEGITISNSNFSNYRQDRQKPQSWWRAHKIVLKT